MPPESPANLSGHPVVTRDEWVAARKELLAKEKEFTRQRDALSQARRDLPWEAVSEDYQFEGAEGPVTLSQLFDGRSQLIVYHFMFGPDWDAGCPHCSFWADNFNPVITHLNHRDVSFAAVSRAPYSALAKYQRRMGWTFRWVSSAGSGFNFDYQVSFRPEDAEDGGAIYNFAPHDVGMSEREGVSVFYRDPSGRMFRTYSTYARGIDLLNTAYNYLDLAPKGRDENGRGQFWVKRHDEYGD